MSSSTHYNPPCRICKGRPGLNHFISKGKLRRACNPCREKENARKRDVRMKKSRETRRKHRKSAREQRVVNLRKGVNVVNLKIITPYSLQMVLMRDDT
jgi:hypothetical protein